jgi:glutamate---cysteine ligase / carboxylate-amine ligase
VDGWMGGWVDELVNYEASAMPPQSEKFTLGVEEEYQIIHPQTRQLTARSPKILEMLQAEWGNDIAKSEFRQSQLEIATPVCRSLQEVRAHLTRLRSAAAAAAATVDSCIAAAGTHPFSHWHDQPITPRPRYQEVAQTYQRLMQELVTFGCHVHVGLNQREMAIPVINRLRIWLPPLLALSASSPFWLGRDTGYASYRSILLHRLPTAGPPLSFDSVADYQSLVDQLVASEIVPDASQIFWDVRLSQRFPTLEFRLADVCLTIDETVLIAGLARGLVWTCYQQALLQTPYPVLRPEFQRAAHWQAARWGLEQDLIDGEAGRVSAPTLVKKLLAFVRPALEEAGEWNEVHTIAQRILQAGTGAARQRSVYRSTESLEAVVDFVIQETATGTR